MDTQAVKKWLKTAVLAAVGGGIAATVTAAFDPARYNLAHDFGSGKAWTFFVEGFVVTFGALLLKSPVGQELISAYKSSQEQLQSATQTLEDAKAQLKPSNTPPVAGGKGGAG